MFFDELDRIERSERRPAREDRRLIPIDSFSQLDTGYTGRPDTDMDKQDYILRTQRDRQVAAIERGRSKIPG